ncbi:MAG TPA: aminoglycoside phosphotransferase family protein [Acidimicrobiia bacterium]|nr:aminoglycoside phosphotransferase family protein [Acidimicrobiia bacterium]
MDKSEITAELVARLLAAQFPQWADLPVTPVEVDGWDNTTFRLGTDKSVRLPSGDAYTAQVDKEHRWLPVLAPQLPLPIPQPLAKGAPSAEFPRPWSIYRWLEGEPATAARIRDLERFATDLAGFLDALYRIDAVDEVAAGPHSHLRGGPVAVLDAQTRAAIAGLNGEIDADAALAAWKRALETRFDAQPVWVHGDVVPSNLLVAGGELAAVIDFGCCAVGDPACDMAVAWMLFSGESRRTFREALGVDDATWERGRGWALWKALIEIHHGGIYDAGAAQPGWVRMGWRTNATELVEDLLSER